MTWPERDVRPHRGGGIDGGREAHALFRIDLDDPGTDRVAHDGLDRSVGALQVDRLDEALTSPIELHEDGVAADLNDDGLERLTDAGVALARRRLAGLLEKGRE
jgi:hypothetical protein